MPSPKGVREESVYRARDAFKDFSHFFAAQFASHWHSTLFLFLSISFPFCFHISTTLCGSWTKSTLCNWHVKINFWQWSSSCVYFPSFHFNSSLTLRRRTKSLWRRRRLRWSWGIETLLIVSLIASHRAAKSPEKDVKMSIFCPISIALLRAEIYVRQREDKEKKNSTSLTIKKHFVRFNLHFKQLKKKLCIKMKNAIIIHDARLFGPREHFYGFRLYLFMVLACLLRLTVFTNISRKALALMMRITRSVCGSCVGCRFNVKLMMKRSVVVNKSSRSRTLTTNRVQQNQNRNRQTRINKKKYTKPN